MKRRGCIALLLVAVALLLAVILYGKHACIWLLYRPPLGEGSRTQDIVPADPAAPDWICHTHYTINALPRRTSIRLERSGRIEVIRQRRNLRAGYLADPGNTEPEWLDETRTDTLPAEVAAAVIDDLFAIGLADYAAGYSEADAEDGGGDIVAWKEGARAGTFTARNIQLRGVSYIRSRLAAAAQAAGLDPSPA